MQDPAPSSGALAVDPGQRTRVADHGVQATAERVLDTGYAPEKWAFDDEVTRVFSDMLERSIPQYHVMRETALEVALHYAQHNTDIVDLGCSRGESLAGLIDRRGADNSYIGVEVSPPMLTACRERFRNLIDQHLVRIDDLDLRETYPRCAASVTQAVLTLIFVPINHRQRLLRDAFHHTVKGGAFILVEKVLGSTAELDALMVERYHALKHVHGYSWDDIERKRLALEGQQVPVTAEWNVDLLRQAGFRQVDAFWRWMNFCAWVAVRDD
jgi:tRNA (cmo5U34)-methyltransferase